MPRTAAAVRKSRKGTPAPPSISTIHSEIAVVDRNNTSDIVDGESTEARSQTPSAGSNPPESPSSWSGSGRSNEERFIHSSSGTSSPSSKRASAASSLSGIGRRMRRALPQLGLPIPNIADEPEKKEKSSDVNRAKSKSPPKEEPKVTERLGDPDSYHESVSLLTPKISPAKAILKQIKVGHEYPQKKGSPIAAGNASLSWRSNHILGHTSESSHFSPSRNAVHQNDVSAMNGRRSHASVVDDFMKSRRHQEETHDAAAAAFEPFHRPLIDEGASSKARRRSSISSLFYPTKSAIIAQHGLVESDHHVRRGIGAAPSSTPSELKQKSRKIKWRMRPNLWRSIFSANDAETLKAKIGQGSGIGSLRPPEVKTEAGAWRNDNPHGENARNHRPNVMPSRRFNSEHGQLYGGPLPSSRSSLSGYSEASPSGGTPRSGSFLEEYDVEGYFGASIVEPEGPKFLPPDFSESESNTHSLAVSRRHKLRANVSDYSTPEGTVKSDRNNSLINLDTSPLSPENSQLSGTAESYEPDWYGTRMVLIMNDEGDQQGRDAMFELDVPEHLRGSPLCPLSPMHKTPGKAMCPYHGRRSTLWNRSIDRSATPKLV